MSNKASGDTANSAFIDSANRDFRNASIKLGRLWEETLCALGQATHIVHSIEAGRPIIKWPPEMLSDYESLLARRTECVEAFKVGYEPRSETNPNGGYSELSPCSIFESANTAPPVVVRHGPFLFQAVVELAKQIIDLGWNGQPGIETDNLHPAYIPSRECTPAYRLCDPQRWAELEMPFLMDPLIQIAFQSAIHRERVAATEILRVRLAEANRQLSHNPAHVPPKLAKPDGPFDGDGFLFDGIEVRFGKANKQRQLIFALWDFKNHRVASPQNVVDVIAKVYGEDNEVEDATLRQLCSDTRKRFQTANCPIDIKLMNGTIQLTPS